MVVLLFIGVDLESFNWSLCVELLAVVLVKLGDSAQNARELEYFSACGPLSWILRE